MYLNQHTSDLSELFQLFKVHSLGFNSQTYITWDFLWSFMHIYLHVAVISWYIFLQELLLQLCTSTKKCPKKTPSVDSYQYNCDKDIEPYLNNCSNTLFVLEHNRQICGYVAAVPCNKKFMESVGNCESAMEEEIHRMKKLKDLSYGLSDFNTENRAHLLIHLDQRTKDAKVLKRVLSMILSVLKSLGSSSVLLETDSEDELDLYSKLGFQQYNSDLNSKVVLRTL